MAGHACASCGKFRSPRYQKHHPLAPGEIPRIGYCRNCAKHATESSDDGNRTDGTRAGVKRRWRYKRRNRVRRHSYYSDASDDDLSSDRIRVFRHPRPRLKCSGRNRVIRVRARSGSRKWHQGYPPRTYQVGDRGSFSSEDQVIIQRTKSKGERDSSACLHQDIFDKSGSSFSVGDRYTIIPRFFNRRLRSSFEHQRSLTEEVTVLPFRTRRFASTFVEPRVYYERRRVFATDPAASFFPEDFHVSRSRRSLLRYGRRVVGIVRPPTRVVYVDSNRRSSAGSIHVQRHSKRVPNPHYTKVTDEPYRICEYGSTSQVVLPEVVPRDNTPVLLPSTADDPIGET